MTFKLPIFMLAAFASLLALPARGQDNGAGQGGAARSGGSTAGQITGQQLVAEAARRIQRVPLSARVHHEVRMLGEVLSGGDGGSYMQLGRGDRVRFELKLSLGDSQQSASLVNVCNGEYLYVRRGLPEQTMITRVRLERVYDAIEAARRAQDAQATPNSASVDWIAIGGMARLLQILEMKFDFGPPHSGRYGERKVWVVEGKWKPHMIACFLPEQRSDIQAGKPPRLDKLPPQAPTGVVLALAADGEVPLFPCYLEYRRQLSPSQKPAALVTLKFDGVRRRPDLTPDDFAYEITEQIPVVDMDVDTFIRSLGIAPASGQETVDSRAPGNQ